MDINNIKKIFLKNVYKVVLIFIIVTGLVYRLYGLFYNHPFWIDEFSAADQGLLIYRFGLKAFFIPQLFLEHHNITTHIIIALSFLIFGIIEWSARLPFALLGGIVPLAIFFVGKKIYNKYIALSATFLASFSYYLITWSRQARGYVLLQIIILLVSCLYIDIIQNQKLKKKSLLLIIALSTLGIATHTFFFLFIISICLHAVYHFREKMHSYLTYKNVTILIILLILTIFFQIKSVTAFIDIVIAGNIGLKNNAWYYHSFLWREYGVLTLLCLIGIISTIKEKRRDGSFLVLYLFIHTFFITFIYGHYISKYLLPIFPLYILFAAKGIETIVKSINPKKNEATVAFTVFFASAFLIISGHVFVSKPKSFYNVNHAFREIALLDYDVIYKPIKDAVKQEGEPIAIIDTWPARSYWYVGQDHQPMYLFRWDGKDKNLTITGQKIGKLDVITKTDGSKIIPHNRNLKLIENLDDLKNVIKLHPKGFIIIDDATLPKDVIDYALQNFKQQAYDDHYTFDDNPYSLWPTTVYSWDIKK